MTRIIAIILITILLGSIGTTLFLLKRNKELNTTISDQAINIKALDNGVVQYKGKFDEVYTRVIEQRRTIAELKQSKDSTITSLMGKLFAANISLKNVTGIGQSTLTIVRDTVVKYRPQNKIYNLSEPPHIFETITIQDTTLARQLKIVDKETRITHINRETIEPRKKFFLTRWFQKRHWVGYSDVVHSNPYITVDSVKQITIINNEKK